MATTWFTSDEHYGHERISELAGRPFTSVEEMDETIIARHNEVVGPDDVTFHLGDFALGQRARDLRFVSRLAGTHVLVAGNHDKCFAGKPTGWQHRAAFYEAGFAAVLDVAVATLPPLTRAGQGRRVMLSHFPYAGDHTGTDRFVDMRPARAGKWLLHGHVHGAYQVRDQGVNVGVDVWNFYPVPARALHELIRDADAGNDWVNRPAGDFHPHAWTPRP